jgi:hypothetical protein
MTSLRSGTLLYPPNQHFNEKETDESNPRGGGGQVHNPPQLHTFMYPLPSYYATNSSWASEG